MKQMFALCFAVCVAVFCCNAQAVGVVQTSFSFLVDDVERANSKISVHPTNQVMENLVDAPIMYASANNQDSCVYRGYNNFLAAIHEAYSEHRPLVLSPDMFWLTICQGVAIHIKRPDFPFNDRFFKEARPDRIRLRNDELAVDSSEWEGFVSDLNEAVQSYTSESLTNFFLADFSQTSEATKLAYRITMLDATSNQFEYAAESGCGFPEITLKGSIKDWEEILERLALLDGFGLQAWRSELEPIFKSVVQTAKGRPDKYFWNGMYKDFSAYGRYSISGWIIKLFPYIEVVDSAQPIEFNDASQTYFRAKKFGENPFLVGDDYLKSTLTTKEIPSGIAFFPITWYNYFDQTEKQLSIHAGFMGIGQDEKGALEPMIAWAVADQQANFDRHRIRSFARTQEKVNHKSLTWVPTFINSKTVYPKYYNQATSDSLRANHFIATQIRLKLKEQGLWHDSLHGKTAEVEVLLNGRIGKVSIQNLPMSRELTAEMTKAIQNVPGEWTAASATFNDLYDEFRMGRESNYAERFFVNSIYYVRLN